MKISNLTDIDPVRAYLTRVGAEPRGLRTAVVRETKGHYWTDIAVIRFNTDGSINCSSLEHAPTELEQSDILRVWGNYQFPSILPLSRIVDPPLMMKEAEAKNVFEFRSVDGKHILMVQVRVERTEPDGTKTKSYVPWTYWDDKKWRMAEPDGELPLWGLDQLPQHRVVFVHEGAKGAAICRWMAEGKTREARDALRDHPWGREIANAAHVGWIGGALNPGRTDWSPLRERGIERVYIVADNDAPGRGAIAHISQQIKVLTMSIEFNDRFPVSFDLGDPFPDHLFKELEGNRFYVGPTMRSLTHPATWATDIKPNPAGTGRPLTFLRDSFKQLWRYVEDADAFVCTEMPEVVRSEAVFNKMVSGFSHLNETSKLVVKSYRGRTANLCYRPDQKGLHVDFRGTSALNLHVPSEIRSVAGDPKVWLDFLRYMFPNPEERRQIERWCATLIARPEVRMGYGLLLVSETQGIGKTTLGAHILAPLVGEWNVGYPAESQINSDFNDWVAHKRLAIINEIYSGSSWKAYNTLKSVITDQSITVNQKYMRQYVVDNWVHVVACSNSMRALKMEHDDRRWFYPEVAETPWPPEKFKQLREWLDSGGLNIIKSWAEGYGDYVRPNDRAPMTAQKQELIEGSRSEAQEEAAALAQLLVDCGRPAALLIKDVVGWVRSSVQGRVFDSDYELRRAMTAAGAIPYRERLKFAGRTQHVLINPALWGEVASMEPEEQRERVKQCIIKAQSLREEQM